MKSSIEDLDIVAREATQNALMLLIEGLVSDPNEPTAEETLALSVCLMITVARLTVHLQNALKDPLAKANVRAAVDYFITKISALGLDKRLDPSIIQRDVTEIPIQSTPTQEGGPSA